MKSKEEVLKRIMCLVCFSDRCALEYNVLDGIRHSLVERENQRQLILDWCKRLDYYESYTEKEKRLMETPIVREKNNEALWDLHDYECIEPLLWSMGLVDSLTGYDDYVLTDLHPPLQIGPDHTLQKLIDSCKDVPLAEIEKHREIAMLWYWRCLEARGGSGTTNYTEAIKSVFGEKELDCLKGYEAFNIEKGDFFVRGKRIARLNEGELARLEIMSERRFYAFEWLFSEEDWENVDLVC